MLHSLAKIIIAPLIALLTLAGYSVTPTQDNLSLGAYQTVAGKTYYLNSPISSSDSSLTLSAFKTPVSDYPLIMTNFGTIGYFTLEPGSSVRQEIISFTGVTQNSDGTATISGLTRGLSPVSPYTASTTIQKAHPGGSTVVISNPPQLYEQMATRANDETITGQWTFTGTSPSLYDAVFAVGSSTLQIPYASWISNNFLDQASTTAKTLAGSYTFPLAQTFTLGLTANATSTFNQGLTLGYSIDSGSDALDVANKSYVDAVGSSGASDANTTTKGLVEEATTAEIDAESSTGATGAKLFMTPFTFASSKFSGHTASTTQYDASSNISTTTATITGKKYFFAVSFSTADSLTASLFLHQEGTHNATTTLQGSVQCDMGGVSSEKCPITFMGTYLATTTEAVQVYVGTDASTKVTVPASRSANIVVIEF